MADAPKAAAVSFTQDGIAVIRMQRGQNRINKEFVDSFHACLDEVESNSDCRGLITTAEGKFFCNGLDLQFLSTKDHEYIEKFMTTFYELLARILVFPLPTLAAINGHCFAGGAMLAFAHDMRVMSNEKGWISYNEVFLGLRLAPFLVSYMQLKVNPKVTHNLMVFGHRFTAAEADSEGMVDKTTPPALLMEESQKLLNKRLEKNEFPREALQIMKKDVYAVALKDLYSSRL